MTLFASSQNITSSKSRSLCSKALGKRPIGEVFHSSDDIVFEDILEIMEMSRQVRQCQKPMLKRIRKSDSKLENIIDDSLLRTQNGRETLPTLIEGEIMEVKSSLGNGLPWFATITASDLDKIAVSAPETISYATSDALTSQLSTDSMQFYSSSNNGELSTDSLLGEEEEYLTISRKSAFVPVIMDEKKNILESTTIEEDEDIWGNLFSIDEF